ncbi:uncharacterized protein LOC114850799 [Betta splendens]|uniref:Uncharacterized protein LOC114850799 n=1 Tax=Betta splendens TaxID=158456 RepID=A0A6P7LWD5_BETSP|nr:uncharacterized protein LOC114850799 [Betta splendens]
MTQLQSLSRFRFTFEDWVTQDERHIKARLTKETCKYAIVVNHDNKLVGFVNANKKRLVSKIRDCMDNQPKIETVHKMVSDVDADAEHLAMINGGGKLLLRVGSPVSRKRRVGKKLKFAKEVQRKLGNACTDVSGTRGAENKKRRAVILNERKEVAPPSAQNSAGGDVSKIEMSRTYFKKALLRRFNESNVRHESTSGPTESSPKACLVQVDAQRNQAITEDMDTMQTSNVPGSSVTSDPSKLKDNMICIKPVLWTVLGHLNPPIYQIVPMKLPQGCTNVSSALK